MNSTRKILPLVFFFSLASTIPNLSLAETGSTEEKQEKEEENQKKTEELIYYHIPEPKGPLKQEKKAEIRKIKNYMATQSVFSGAEAPTFMLNAKKGIVSAGAFTGSYDGASFSLALHKEGKLSGNLNIDAQYNIFNQFSTEKALQAYTQGKVKSASLNLMLGLMDGSADDKVKGFSLNKFKVGAGYNFNIKGMKFNPSLNYAEQSRWLGGTTGRGLEFYLSNTENPLYLATEKGKNEFCFMSNKWFAGFGWMKAIAEQFYSINEGSGKGSLIDVYGGIAMNKFSLLFNYNRNKTSTDVYAKLPDGSNFLIGNEKQDYSSIEADVWYKGKKLGAGIGYCHEKTNNSAGKKGNNKFRLGMAYFLK